MMRPAWLVGWPILAQLGACATSPPSTPPHEAGAGAPPGWHYRARLHDDLAEVEVELCFVGTPSGPLVPANRAGAPYLEDPRLVRDGRRLATQDGTVVLDGLQGGDCIAYTVDFRAMERGEAGSRRISREGESLLVRPTMWLWHPKSLSRASEITVTLEHAADVEVSVPWAVHRGERGRSGTSYRLDSTVFRWLGYSVFGRLDLQRFTHDGLDIELAVLDAPLDVDQPGLRGWITDAADAVGMLYDGFPHDRLQVVVVPVTGGGGGSVYFGAAGRGGGPGVYILMNAGADPEELSGGWTTTHELLHHGMPFVRDAWMAEGWVSYYTEIMRTRIGHRSEQEGWQALYDAFLRGRRTTRPMTLQATSDHMHDTFAYQRVYWGGAAIAFATDVELRLSSQAERSLDDAVRHLRACCGDAPRRFDARTLLEKLDAWHGQPVFTRQADAFLPRVGFPEVEVIFGRLGITIVDGAVVLDDGHPAADVRRAIMAPRVGGGLRPPSRASSQLE